jgi:hypothetical protein
MVIIHRGLTQRLAGDRCAELLDMMSEKFCIIRARRAFTFGGAMAKLGGCVRSFG